MPSNSPGNDTPPDPLGLPAEGTSSPVLWRFLNGTREAFCLLQPHPIGFELRYMLDGVQLIGVVSTGDLVKEKIKANIAQTEKLFGFTYKIGDRTVTTNDIDNILRTENDEKKRLEAWTASRNLSPPTAGADHANIHPGRE